MIGHLGSSESACLLHRWSHASWTFTPFKSLPMLKMFLIQLILPLFLHVLSAISDHIHRKCLNLTWLLHAADTALFLQHVLPAPPKVIGQLISFNLWLTMHLIFYLWLLMKWSCYTDTSQGLSEHGFSGSLRYGRTQALTNDQGQASVVPLPNVRWRSSSSCLMTYMREKLLYFPNIVIPALLLEKGLRSVDCSCCDFIMKSYPYLFLDHVMHSGIVTNVCFHGFLASWLRQCLLQMCCIACCHCMGYCSPYHRCIVLSLHLHWHLILKHDFQVQNIWCKRKFLSQEPKVLWLSVGSHLILRLNKLMKHQHLSRISVGLHHRPQRHANREPCVPSGTAGTKIIRLTPVSHKNPRRCVGGGCLGKMYSFSQISDHLVPGPIEVVEDSVFRYVAYVDELGLLAYPPPQFVHASVPLNDLIAFLPVSHAWKIAATHGISVGSRCTAAQLLMLVKNHSCVRCCVLFTVFSMGPGPGKLNVRWVIKCRKKKKYIIIAASTYSVWISTTASWRQAHTYNAI